MMVRLTSRASRTKVAQRLMHTMRPIQRDPNSRQSAAPVPANDRRTVWKAGSKGAKAWVALLLNRTLPTAAPSWQARWSGEGHRCCPVPLLDYHLNAFLLSGLYSIITEKEKAGLTCRHHLAKSIWQGKRISDALFPHCLMHIIALLFVETTFSFIKSTENEHVFGGTQRMSN